MRMGPIGNERVKISKPTSIENIATLFPSMDDNNSISFIADDSKDNRKLFFSAYVCTFFTVSNDLTG